MDIMLRKKNGSASDDEQKGKAKEEVTELVQADFPPCMASFRKYNKDLKDEDRHAFKSSEYQDLRNDESMKAIIAHIFDYESDITDIESNMFANSNKLKLVFDFIDLSFQLFDKQIDELEVETIRKYYRYKKGTSSDLFEVRHSLGKLS